MIYILVEEVKPEIMERQTVGNVGIAKLQHSVAFSVNPVDNARMKSMNIL